MKKPKPLGMCTAIPTSDIVSVVIEVIEPEPTNDMGWIKWWLTAIGETDQKLRDEVRDACKTGVPVIWKDGTTEFCDAKSTTEYYVNRAKNMWKDNLHSHTIPL